MSPEDSIRYNQPRFGYAMAFDECVENPSPYEYVKKSCDRTYRWLVRCKDELNKLNAEEDTVNRGQMLFGINQGGTYIDIRIEHMKRITEIDLPGYAVGGLAVGEPTEVMYRILDEVLPYAPAEKPRYLMGWELVNIKRAFSGNRFLRLRAAARKRKGMSSFTYDGRSTLTIKI